MYICNEGEDSRLLSEKGTPMGMIMFVIIGMCAGWIATRIFKTPSSMVQNLVIGVTGAAVGGMLMRTAGVMATGMFGTLISATVGALVLLYVIQLIR